MVAPSTALATYRPDIAGSFVEFDLEADRLGFIGLKCAPVIEVDSPAESPGKIPLEAILKGGDDERAPGATYAQGYGGKFEKWSYACQEHGVEEPIDDRQKRMYARYFDAEMWAAKRARDRVLRNHEQRIAALFAADANTNAAGTAWSTWATASPIANVETAVETLAARVGVEPNAIALTRKAFRQLRNCAQVIDRITSSGAGNPAKATDVTAQMIAQVLDLKYVFVAGGWKNSANEKQDASLSRIWDSTRASVFVVAETGDIQEPCFARTIHWGEDGSNIGGTMETYRNESRRSDIVRCRLDVDEVVMYSAMCQTITGVL